MKINHIKIGLLSLLVTVFVCSCNKDESPFSGGDNYISSFRLTQGDITLNAAISNGSMVLTAPENLSLEGATASVTLSENASIAPDPASVTHWDEEQTFVVTAHNGTASTYTYSVERNAVSKDGDITLLTQADVEALAALNLTEINGNLIIGAATGPDSVYSLAPLSSLKTIVNGLTIDATYAGESLAGLENLEKVGALQIMGELQVWPDAKIKKVELPKLKTIMTDLIVNPSSVETLRLPELVSIDKNFSVTASDIAVMELPKLETIAGNLTFQGTNPRNSGDGNTTLTAAEFPALRKIGGEVHFTHWDEMTAIAMPLLESATAITVNYMPKIASVAMPRLKALPGQIYFSESPFLHEFDFSSLQSVGANLSMTTLGELENLDGLKSLTTIGAMASISNLPKLKSIQGLKALKTVGGLMRMTSCPMLEDETLSGLSNLSSVGGDIQFAGTPFKKFTGLSLTKVKGNLMLSGSGIEEVDVRNIDITGILQLASISTPFVLKGKTAYKGDLTLSNSIPGVMEGFEEVDNLTYTANSATAPDRPLNIRKVNGNLTASGGQLKAFRMPLLEEVVGTFNLSCSSSVPTEIELPALKKTGPVTINPNALPVVTLPALQSINGDCTFQTYRVTKIQMPSLTTINGRLILNGGNVANVGLANLDGFSTLTSVQGVTATMNMNLTDFTGLKNALSSFTPADWRITRNIYNPTYQDMLDGKYVKP